MAQNNYIKGDFNIFINEQCRKDMTVNDIDVVMHKYNVGYTGGKNVLRIIESKQEHEPTMKKSQKNVHILIYKILKQANIPGYVFEHYLVRGSKPYDTVKLINILTGNTFYLGRNELIDFLDFKKQY